MGKTEPRHTDLTRVLQDNELAQLSGSPLNSEQSCAAICSIIKLSPESLGEVYGRTPGGGHRPAGTQLQGALLRAWAGTV